MLSPKTPYKLIKSNIVHILTRITGVSYKKFTTISWKALKNTVPTFIYKIYYLLRIIYSEIY
jgi:hypothetical protein